MHAPALDTNDSIRRAATARTLHFGPYAAVFARCRVEPPRKTRKNKSFCLRNTTQTPERRKLLTAPAVEVNAHLFGRESGHAVLQQPHHFPWAERPYPVLFKIFLDFVQGVWILEQRVCHCAKSRIHFSFHLAFKGLSIHQTLLDGAYQLLKCDLRRTRARDSCEGNLLASESYETDFLNKKTRACILPDFKRLAVSSDTFKTYFRILRCSS